MKPAVLAPFVLLTGLTGCAARPDDNPPTDQPGLPMATVDLKQLEDELYRHGLASFRRIREAHPKDHFYSIAFYTSGSFGYAAVTASTVEGLEQVAQSYKRMDRYKHRALGDLKLDLKWSPDDSPLHAADDNVLHALEPIMSRVAAESDRLFDLDDSGRSYREFTGEVEDRFLNALKRIDAEGVFGRGDERKGVVVNLLMGDQSDEARLRFAARVNPPESVEMLKRDLDAANRLRR